MRRTGSNKRAVTAAVGVVVATMLASACTAGAAPISDAAFFNPLSHTLVTFEVDGAGNPLNIAESGAVQMPAGEYASLGITFNPAITWVNDSGADFEAAQAIGGSAPVAIPDFLEDAFRIQFSPPVHAVGFWVVDNTGRPTRPQFTALDGALQTIEQVTFTGGFVDGTIGVAAYGFMGITSTTPIAAVDIVKDATNFDSFRFSTVPEPSAAAAAALCGMLMTLARRRR